MIKRKLQIKYSLWNKHRQVASWKNKLIGVPCFIIGNSPSLNDHPTHLLNGLFTIGINRAFKKLETTILLWQDIELYLSCQKELKSIKSILYARDAADPKGIAYHFRLLNAPYHLTNSPLRLSGRGSSGPLAFQLAHSLGCDPIVFLGYDCKYRGEQTDFWGINKDHKVHTLIACSRGLNWIKKCDHKRKLIFCEDGSSQKNEISLEKALEICKITKDSYKNKDYFENKLFE